MEIEIEYDQSLDCIVIHATGLIVFEDLPVIGQSLLEHEKFRTNINQIFDCTHGELNLTTNELQQAAEDFGQIIDVLGLDRKLGLVVSRDVDFGQMRQYEVFFQSGPNVLVRVFRSFAEACEWIES